jgi:hypothetical protein
MITRIIAVPGTHAWDGTKKDWYSPDSPFMRTAGDQDVVQIDPDNPFVWSTRLGGLGKDKFVVWRGAGVNFYQYVVPPRCKDRRIPPMETIVLSHSHGLQPVLFAAAKGLQIDTFVDVCGPVRMDLLPIARAARKNIRRWVHIHAGKRDLWQWFGEIGDEHFGIVRKHPLAHQNIAVDTADHGEILRDPKYFQIVIDALKGKA